MTTPEDTIQHGKEVARLRGRAFANKVRELIHEGNVRRIIIKNDSGHTVMEIPVTAGVVVAVAAPVVAAIGAIAALASEWSIEVEHTDDAVANSTEDAGETG